MAGKLAEKLGRGKVAEIAVIAILVLVVLAVFFASFGGGGEDAGGEDAGGESADTGEELARILSRVEGAGDVEVYLTYASEGETVIATETQTAPDGTVTSAPVLVGGDVVVLEQKRPAIAGVLIVAEGARELAVRFRLLEAAAAALDVDQSIIKVYAKEGTKR